MSDYIIVGTRMTKKILPCDSDDDQDRWLTRSDALVVAMSIAMSEPWPRRLLATTLAMMCRFTRVADRLIDAFVEDRDDRPISSQALRHLKAHASLSTFDLVMGQHKLHVEMLKSEYFGQLPVQAEIMRLGSLMTVLSAGHVFEDARRKRARSAARWKARNDLANRQREALERR